MFWILRTGAPWRDLLPGYGDWKNTHRRFCRWRDKGTWEKLLETLIDEPDYEWLMTGASHPGSCSYSVFGYLGAGLVTTVSNTSFNPAYVYIALH